MSAIDSPAISKNPYGIIIENTHLSEKFVKHLIFLIQWVK